MKKKELMMYGERVLAEEELSQVTSEHLYVVLLEKVEEMEIFYFYDIRELFYSKGRPIFVVFINEKEHLTLVRSRSGKLQWKHCLLTHLFERPIDSRQIKCSQEEVVKIIIQKQVSINDANLKEKYRQIKETIDLKMEEVPFLPKGFEKWINKTGKNKKLFNRNGVIYYEKKHDKTIGFCTNCNEHIELKEGKTSLYRDFYAKGKGDLYTTPQQIRSGLICSCPSCDTIVTLKTKAYKNFVNKDEWYIVQKTKNKNLIIRFFKGQAVYNTPSHFPVVSYWEATRIFLNKDGTYDIYSYDTFKNTGHIRWIEGIKKKPTCAYWDSDCSLVFGPIYSGNKKNLFEGTVLQYCEWAKTLTHLNGAKVDDMITFIKHPIIEKLEKEGLSELVSGLYSHSDSIKKDFLIKENKPHKWLGLSKEQYNQVKRLNLSRYQLSSYKHFYNYILEKNERGEIIKGKLLSDQDYLYSSDLFSNKLDIILKKTSFTRAINYIEKQYAKKKDLWLSRAEGNVLKGKKEVVIEWSDYLEMSQKVEDQLSKKGKQIEPFDLFPIDLNKSHQEIGELLDWETTKDQVVIMQKLKTNWERFAFEDEETRLFLTFPETPRDLINESNCLKHCVKSYIDRICQESTSIFFVRAIEKPKDPLYTMEYKDGKIVQFRGKANTCVSDEALAFKEKWLNYIEAKKLSV